MMVFTAQSTLNVYGNARSSILTATQMHALIREPGREAIYDIYCSLHVYCIAMTIVKFLPEAGSAPLTIKQACLGCQCSIQSRASMLYKHALTFESVLE